ncbi:MAG: Rieske (2Fe-2S) protein [Candidatus Marinimicrobia bacterium]|nr:Rieske (2Fe-2S) protein [Candidatus Neomarinimicrobiota bacterium]MBL7109598.1 Rieske (2Fe-2S) protein [Candidatus Neomarinimicrobiota bacterium]
MKKGEGQKQNRKEFLKKFGIFGVLILAVGSFVKNLIVFVSPESKTKSTHRYLVGKKSEISVGKSKEISIQGKPAFVVRLDEGFKVFSGVCTHLGCIIKWEENNNRFFCPCHNGVFDKTGKVVSGPPPEPLKEFEVEEDGNLVFIQVEDKRKGPWV